MRPRNKTKLRHIAIGTDANYMPRTMVFYESLKTVHNNFILYIFCYDEVSYKTLRELNYNQVILVHPSEYEDEELLKVKKDKIRLYEYYWSLNPTTGRKTIRKVKENDFISLADCDMMFFQSPEVIFEELEGADVLIQSNNFSLPFAKDYIPVGYYCTSFQCFRNNKNGRSILDFWHKKCMQWCSSRFENGLFGEQKYLEEWRSRFKNVREIANPGTNIAPWNVQRFDLSIKNKKIFLNNKWPLIFYHFHSFRMNFKNLKYIITGDRHNNYPIPKVAIELIYRPYIQKMKAAVKTLRKIKVYQDYINQNPEGHYHVQNQNS